MLQHAGIKWAKRSKYLGQCLAHCKCLPLFFCLVELPLFSSLELHGCCCLVAKLCLTPLWLHGLQPARLLCPWDSPGKNTGVGCYFLLQGIFQTQGPNLHLLHWQVDSLPLSHQQSPTFMAYHIYSSIASTPASWVTCSFTLPSLPSPLSSPLT